jgi:hypothetical protein
MEFSSFKLTKITLLYLSFDKRMESSPSWLVYTCKLLRILSYPKYFITKGVSGNFGVLFFTLSSFDFKNTSLAFASSRNASRLLMVFFP